MRLGKMILGDVKFQVRYGFYLLYVILTILYTVVLLSLPQLWRDKASTILIFSDPAAMGMFFMGAIILLEKSQRVLCALAVTPVRVVEYLLSKIISIGIISTMTAVIIAVAVGKKNIVIIALGTILSGMLFTLLGIIIASKIESLNQFILWTVPFESIGFGPAVLYLFGVDFPGFGYYPANICIEMIQGEWPGFIKISILCLLLVCLFLIAHENVRRMWSSMGGARL